jgi:hypothetical protein
MGTAAGILMGLGAIAFLLIKTRFRRRDAPSDMGSVSHVWVVEHRMGRRDDDS